VQLCVREYVKNDGNPGYAVAFDIVGCVDRPNAVLHIQPPPLNITATEIPKGTGKAASGTDKDSSQAESSATAKAAKPKRKIRVEGDKSSDMDTEIPF
jgi:hypothetical protein